MKILKKEKNKTNRILKIRRGTLLYSKNFFSSFSKLGVGGGGQPNNFSFRPKHARFLPIMLYS